MRAKSKNCIEEVNSLCGKKTRGSEIAVSVVAADSRFPSMIEATSSMWRMVFAVSGTRCFLLKRKKEPLD